MPASGRLQKRAGQSVCSTIASDYQRVAANKVSGNTIGPFLQNQVLKIRTDVGNSRDITELSPEQEVTIGPSV